MPKLRCLPEDRQLYTSSGGVRRWVQAQNTFQRGVLRGTGSQLLGKLSRSPHLLRFDATDFGTIRHDIENSCDQYIIWWPLCCFADHPDPLCLRTLHGCTFTFVLGLPDTVPDSEVLLQGLCKVVRPQPPLLARPLYDATTASLF